jgi:mRNA interferase MazF
MIGLGHGQIWWADIPDEKVRPVLVLTRSNVAPLLRQVLVAPITSTSRGLATEVSLDEQNGVVTGSVASVDNARQLSVSDLLRQVGEIDIVRWPEVCTAMAAVLGC